MPSLYAPVPIEARQLGYRLGLGDIQLRQPCSGYDRLCVCDDCLTGDETLAAMGRLPGSRQEVARLRDDLELLAINEDARSAA